MLPGASPTGTVEHTTFGKGSALANLEKRRCFISLFVAELKIKH